MSNTIQRAPSPALRPFVRTLWVRRTIATRRAGPRSASTCCRPARAPRLPPRRARRCGSSTGPTIASGARSAAPSSAARAGLLRARRLAADALGRRAAPPGRGAGCCSARRPASSPSGTRRSPTSGAARRGELRERLCEAAIGRARLDALRGAPPRAPAARPRPASRGRATRSAGFDARRRRRRARRASGYSHRRFVALFRERGRALAEALLRAFCASSRCSSAPPRQRRRRGPARARGRLQRSGALQPRVPRAGRRLAGRVPASVAPASSHHVPVGRVEVNSVQDRGRAGRPA